jgi:uncharacterized protein involved in exopolysaccharide biosynthesis
MSEQSFSTISEDEISLKDIIDFLIDSWKTILLGGVAGGLLGWGYVVITPVKYQATASIQVAKIAGNDVEDPGMLVEKLKLPMYFSKKTYVACNVMNQLKPGETIAKILKPTLVKTAGIITITYQEDSPENAKKCLESVLDDIRVNQRLLAEPIFERKTNQLFNLKLKLESAEKAIKRLSDKSVSLDFSDSKFSASALLLATTLNKEKEIEDLKIEIKDLEIQLVKPQTEEASLITQIFAPQQKVSPKTANVLLTSLFGGLFLGLMFVIGQRTYRAYKASN